VTAVFGPPGRAAGRAYLSCKGNRRHASSAEAGLPAMAPQWVNRGCAPSVGRAQDLSSSCWTSIDQPETLRRPSHEFRNEGDQRQVQQQGRDAPGSCAARSRPAACTCRCPWRPRSRCRSAPRSPPRSSGPAGPSGRPPGRRSRPRRDSRSGERTARRARAGPTCWRRCRRDEEQHRSDVAELQGPRGPGGRWRVAAAWPKRPLPVGGMSGRPARVDPGRVKTSSDDRSLAQTSPSWPRQQATEHFHLLHADPEDEFSIRFLGFDVFTRPRPKAAVCHAGGDRAVATDHNTPRSESVQPITTATRRARHLACSPSREAGSFPDPKGAFAGIA
jgi:hypothetical protein